ncbi:hypothetical protein ARMGADRAFT_1035370 [Armillaria gallica]|uniref:Uncharacterized protein n=1 Tax=Armillaria gallica TaxID=47427 RepID=A0A2H3D5Y8_ARMGA|nr:hypothetical protein ARMGADRAFT_1035370 [Armillaria gallica]
MPEDKTCSVCVAERISSITVLQAPPHRESSMAQHNRRMFDGQDAQERVEQRRQVVGGIDSSSRVEVFSPPTLPTASVVHVPSWLQHGLPSRPKNCFNILVPVGVVLLSRDEERIRPSRKAFSARIDWRANALPKTHSSSVCSKHLPTSPASRLGAFLPDIEAETGRSGERRRGRKIHKASSLNPRALMRYSEMIERVLPQTSPVCALEKVAPSSRVMMVGVEET